MLKIANQENIFIFLEEIRFLYTSCVLLFLFFPVRLNLLQVSNRDSKTNYHGFFYHLFILQSL